MRVLSATLIALFALFFKVVRCGDNAHSNPWAKRHNPRSSQLDTAANQNTTHLEKRIDGAAFTFYDTGLGACGTVNGPNDYIVALNAAQFDEGSHCYQTITITVNGKTAQAQITDRCAGCPPNSGLDFSRGLFNFFGPESAGVLTGSWYFGVPTPTSTWKPPPTSTSVEKPTSTWSPPPASTTSSSVSSSQVHTSSSSVATPTPTPLIPPSEVGNIADLFLIFIQIGSIAVTGHAGYSPN